MLSFYLDYYPGYRDKETMKVIRHESLGIYVYANPRNKREQNFNEDWPRQPKPYVAVGLNLW